MKRVTAAQVDRLAREPGRHHIDDNLYLDVKARGRPSWLFRYVATSGRRRDMSLGLYPRVTLAAVNEQLLNWRSVLAGGEDPLEVRRNKRVQLQVREEKNALTLRKAAEAFIEAKRHSWRNDKHANQWMTSLSHLGELMDTPLAAIQSPALFAVLEPLNREKHETTSRIRQRVEAIYNREILRGSVEHNPAAALRGHLPAPARKQNFASLSWQDTPAFVKRLRDSGLAQSTRLAFEFLILSAARTQEILGATWEEIDQERMVWTIAGKRMKTGVPHEVPITRRMAEILRAMEVQRGGGWDWVFPSPQRRVQPLSNNAFLAALDRMGLRGKVTVHGFRATFSTWAYEQTRFRSEVVEAALAHREQNAVKAAYARADYWQARIDLANAWSSFSAPG